MPFQTAPTQFTTVDGNKIAYRRLGKAGDIPLLFITHFRGTMDLIDSLLADTIAQSRELIIFDNTGCGHSDGTIPETLQDAALIAAHFVEAIGLSKVDVLGFSMGGLIAQILAVDHSQLVNRLVLSGTQSSYSEGAVSAPREIFQLAGGSEEPTEETMMKLFFYPTSSSKKLGHAWWERTQERDVAGEKRTTFVDRAGGQRQQAAITKFVTDLQFFERVKQLELPILITNGKNDVMTPTPNSWLMQQNLPNAHLHLYPDSGHGHLYQEPELYAKHLELFLA